MPDLLGSAIIEAIDQGLEIHLRGPDVPIPGSDGDLEVVLETFVGERLLSWKQRIDRDTMTGEIGEAALAYALAVGAHAMHKARTAPPEESNR